MARNPEEITAEEIENLWSALGAITKQNKALRHKFRDKKRSIQKQQRIISDIAHFALLFLNSLDERSLTQDQLVKFRALENTLKLAKSYIRGKRDYPDGKDDYNPHHHPHTVTNINISNIWEDKPLLEPTDRIMREE